MSKVIKSPVERWPGQVTISDPMNYDQVRKIEDAMDAGHGFDPSSYMSKLQEVEVVWTSKINQASLPAILACVESWELKDFPENVTEANFPATPRGDAMELAAWLFGEIQSVYYGEIEVKND